MKIASFRLPKRRFSTRCMPLAFASLVVVASACRFGEPAPAENADGTAPRTADIDPLAEGSKREHPLVEQRRGADALRQRAEWSKKALLVENAISRIGVQNDASCARKSTDEIKCWGWNYEGALGAPNSPAGAPSTVINSTTPRKVTTITESLRSFSAGAYNLCVVSSVGALKCLGSNFFGQLGDGSNSGSYLPNIPSGLGSGVLRTATRFNKTCAILENKKLKCWGYTISTLPIEIPGVIEGILQVALGQEHQCLLNDNFGVQCWGSNQRGQLGVGITPTTVSAPVSVSGLEKGVVQVATGASHSCALLADATVKCWGFNSHGQLGTGNQENQNYPTPVQGLSGDVTALSLGDDYSCALLSDGQVMCWGRNSNGQLGTGTLVDSAVPVAVVSLQEGNVALGAGAKHTCVMNSAEQMQCWGADSFGSLGGGQGAGNYPFPSIVKGF